MMMILCYQLHQIHIGAEGGITPPIQAREQIFKMILLKFRRGYQMTMGKGRVPIKRYQREYYYVCDLGGRGGRLRPTKITFSKNNKTIGAESADTSGAELW